MTILVDDLVPTNCGRWWSRCYRRPPRPPYGGRRRTIPDRNCFAAIVFMARTPLRLLPARELGCGSSAACWRRLTEWAKAGVFDQLHLEVLDRLGARPAGLVAGQCGHHERAGQAWGTMWAQFPSIVASLGPSSARRWGGGAGVLAGGRRQGLRHGGQPGRAAPAWDQAAARAAWDRVLDPAWAPPLDDRAGAVVAELLQAPAGAMGPRLGPVVRVRAGGLRGRLLHRR
jgi:transposase